MTFKKTAIVLILLAMLAGGCSPSFCDSSSIDYDVERCQIYKREWLQRMQHLQMQQEMQQIQSEIFTMKLNQLGY